MPDYSYDKKYFEILRKRSFLQILIRNILFIPLRPYLKGDVLDLGCGIGEVAGHVQDKNRYFGIDINIYCVDFLQQKGIRSKIGSAYQIPLDAHSVDVVIMSHVLEHLDDPARAMNEISRVLRPYGTLIVIVPMRYGYDTDPSHRVFYDPEQLRNLAQEYHYEEQSISVFPIP